MTLKNTPAVSVDSRHKVGLAFILWQEIIATTCKMFAERLIYLENSTFFQSQKNVHID